ncbi:MAG: DUF1015 family protein [Gemmatimonadales bacterium]
MTPTLPELVTPFRGERYGDPGAGEEALSRRLAPPYDVISKDERARLAALDPHNIVHLVLPEAAAPADPYARAAERLAEWRRAGVLVRDAAPAVYVVAQDFTLPTGERRTRLGMFAALAAEPYETRRVRPHEKTHAGPKADRLALLRATQTSLESILVLAPDPDGALSSGLARVVQRPPDARAELDGVGIRLWVVSGADASRLAAHGSRLPLYIADGHHRYETAVAYARERPAADRLLAFIVSVADPGLTVLATHRVIYGAGRDATKLTERWRARFEVSQIPPDADHLALLARAGARGTACLVAWPGDYELCLVLKTAAPLAGLPELGRTEAVRSLDVAVVEALVVQEILRAGQATPTLTYKADAAEALQAVRAGKAAAAVLLNPTRVNQVLAVADVGDVMPPKSTYFAPKVPGGLVVRPLA